MELDLDKHSIEIITENDVAVYDCSTQTITLTQEASATLEEAFGEGLSIWQIRKQLFVVTLYDEWLYGGVFNEPWSSAAIQFPIISVESHEGRLSFHLSPGLSANEASYQQNFQEVHDFFAHLGKLLE